MGMSKKCCPFPKITTPWHTSQLLGLDKEINQYRTYYSPLEVGLWWHWEMFEEQNDILVWVSGVMLYLYWSLISISIQSQWKNNKKLFFACNRRRTTYHFGAIGLGIQISGADLVWNIFSRVERSKQGSIAPKHLYTVVSWLFLCVMLDAQPNTHIFVSLLLFSLLKVRPNWLDKDDGQLSNKTMSIDSRATGDLSYDTGFPISTV